MRLIDADEVLKTLKMVTDPTVAKDVLEHIIVTTPTAYDVDKYRWHDLREKTEEGEGPSPGDIVVSNNINNFPVVATRILKIDGNYYDNNFLKSFGMIEEGEIFPKLERDASEEFNEEGFIIKLESCRIVAWKKIQPIDSEVE